MLKKDKIIEGVIRGASNRAIARGLNTSEAYVRVVRAEHERDFWKNESEEKDKVIEHLKMRNDELLELKAKLIGDGKI